MTNREAVLLATLINLLCPVASAYAEVRPDCVPAVRVVIDASLTTYRIDKVSDLGQVAGLSLAIRDAMEHAYRTRGYMEGHP